MVIKRKGSRRKPQRKQEEYFRLNQKITVAEVRLVGEGIESRVYPRSEALSIAREKGLDLIEISNKGEYPICKVMDFAKFFYERKKIQKAKERGNKITMKEVRIAPTIGEHDLAFKTRHAISFLKNGASVRVYVFFKRRRDFYIHKDLAREQLKNLVEVLEKHGGKRKHEIKLLHRQIFTIIDPIKKKN